MPQVVHSLGSTSISSSYTAYTAYGGSQSTGTASYGSDNLPAFTNNELGIMPGSTIDSVFFRVESLGSPLHGTADRTLVVNGNTVTTWLPAATDIDITSLMSAGSNVITLKFRSAKNNTSYPSEPPISGPPNTKTNIGSLSFNDISIIINYTLPFSACTPPSSASLSAALSEGNLDLSFSGAAGGTNNAITDLEVQYAESDDNVNWGDWVAYATIPTGSGSGSISVAPSSTRGKYRKFQVRVRGAAGADYYSGWKAVTGSVRKNSAPAAPGVTAPVASKTIYNSQPRILATVGSDTDGHSQTLAASGYTASSGGAQAPGKKLLLRRSSAASAGAQSVSVSSTDALGVASSATARSFTYAVPAWTDASLVAGETPIKAAHMTELQAAINNVRAYYGLAAYPFSSITAGVTGLVGWTGHVAELRAAIDEVVSLVNGWDTANSTNDISLPAWTTISVNCPAAAIIAQLRAAIPLL